MVFTKAGYKTKEVSVGAKLGGWYAGNFIFGGLIGFLIVDPATGAMWTLSPKEVNENLSADAAFLKQNNGLMIVLRKDVPQSLSDKMQLISDTGY